MGDNSEFKDKKKEHRARQSGVKAQKKKDKKAKQENLTDRQKNPKAFAINNAIRAERNFRRKEDITAKKQHIPIVDKTPEEPPPLMIAVVGPPKVGKTTLINNLIRSFTRTNVTNINGPITLVTSKKRRITLIECNNDINSMIDIAKCADLVLLLCDASFGFEMEIFEFLNICQVHGMPKIMGVLTHLDMIKNAKTLKNRKKELKHRFWTEVYQGAKLFYLSGIIHGEYLRNEITNLGRFIAVMKLRPLTWRGAHSYILADRMEDVTNTEKIRLDPKVDRDVVLYGYVRGVPINKETMVHIAGLGDLRIDDLSALPDPCPLPSAEKKRSLLEKEKLLYAPMSGVGGIVYDKDAVYIELDGSHSHYFNNNENDQEKNDLINAFMECKETLDTKIENLDFKLFSDGDVIKSKDFKDDVDNDENEDEELGDSENEDEDEDVSDNDVEKPSNASDLGWKIESDEEIEEDENSTDESSDEEYQEMGKNKKFSKNKRNDIALDDDDDSEMDEDGKSVDENMPNMSWKEGLAQRARDAYLDRQANTQNLMKIVYGVFNKFNKYNTDEGKKDEDELKGSDDEDENNLGGLFKIVTEKQHKEQKEKLNRDSDECCFFENYSGSTRVWSTDDSKEIIKNCFVTGKWRASEDAAELLRLDDLSDADSDVYGDFEDYETGEKHNSKAKNSDENNKEDNNETKEDEKSKKRKFSSRVEESNMTKNELMAKKMKLKAKFDADYDNKDDEGRITGDHGYYEELKSEAQRQSELNKSEFAKLDDNLRVEIEGYRPGLYIRMNFKNLPCEFVSNFDPKYPVLIGGLNMSEENVGYVSCKVKKHRWYKKILKTTDPIIISLGWRRFQTIPIYAKIEDNLKKRYLKYTPNHITCNMTFWGPITPQNTGFLAIQTISNNLQEIKHLGFRIAATGCVTEIDKSTEIMKKLKLIGQPLKIFKKSAFIKGMFTSSLEVAKFEGAKIKTVSGIRGQIKKACKAPEGSFRATFEDKILLSDIVFCRTWFRVDVPKFYAPITTLLLPPDNKAQWQGMKTVGQLKRERSLKNSVNSDSLYTEIEREKKLFRPLVIPKNLQKSLPYKDKPRFGPLNPNKPIERVAVIHSPHEQKMAKMMKMIKANFEHKKQKMKEETTKRVEKFRREKQREELHKLKKQKEVKRKIFRALSKYKSNDDDSGSRGRSSRGGGRGGGRGGRGGIRRGR